ncbi:GreA/GreB family elongation factor [Actinacidiphila rubida]|uniref:Transcription elongation factor, GreA/GreB family n=1 Tax=Actinacidiphila rubida TaxID=310780 RepID=A0A1H8T8V9_9ACTN|nr:GreA/GreB family elongation factor [Actinacidiphila rubida]SEO86923.1 Transcription elongation factor, GreA/GreB family [Actinacidiphila rubida]
MAGEPAPISPDARRALEKDLADLRAERDAVAATLRGGNDYEGDRADQADELQRADDLTRLDDRIDELTDRLKQAAVAGPPAKGVAGVGSRVTVRFADGTTQTLHIGEIADDEDPSVVTADSPLGRALMGRRSGDAVAYDAPAGPSTATVTSVGDTHSR